MMVVIAEKRTVCLSYGRLIENNEDTSDRRYSYQATAKEASGRLDMADSMAEERKELIGRRAASRATSSLLTKTPPSLWDNIHRTTTKTSQEE